MNAGEQFHLSRFQALTVAEQDTEIMQRIEELVVLFAKFERVILIVRASQKYPWDVSSFTHYEITLT